jgi:8-oxo-dGTP diphosphatase
VDITKDYGEATLGLFIKNNWVMLLAEATRNIGIGKLRGPGGGIKPGETPRKGLAREGFEELHVTIDERAAEHVAVLDCFNRRAGGDIFHAHVLVYLVRGWRGFFRETKDGGMINPRLYFLSNLPFNRMMPGDPYWIREVVFSGRKIWGEFHYGPGQISLECEPIIRDLPASMMDNL